MAFENNVDFALRKKAHDVFTGKDERGKAPAFNKTPDIDRNFIKNHTEWSLYSSSSCSVVSPLSFVSLYTLHSKHWSFLGLWKDKLYSLQKMSR
jgi:hypothetical protein